MKRDMIYSVALHVTMVFSLVVITPFQPKINTDLGDVIRVNLRAMPLTQTVKPAPQPVEIPQAMTEDAELAVLPDAKSVTEAKKIKPKEKKKDEPKPYQSQTNKGDQTQTGKKDGAKDVSDNLAGSKFGSASVDNASFDYPYWFVQAFSKIQFNWSNPVYSIEPLSCIVYFQVIRSGRIIKIEVEKSSGIDAFDGACVRAIQKSKPLPPLPAEFVDEIIGIHLEFPYAPR
jgi:TonB family protein